MLFQCEVLPCPYYSKGGRRIWNKRISTEPLKNTNRVSFLNEILHIYVHILMGVIFNLYTFFFVISN